MSGNREKCSSQFPREQGDVSFASFVRPAVRKLKDSDIKKQFLTVEKLEPLRLASATLMILQIVVVSFTAGDAG